MECLGSGLGLFVRDCFFRVVSVRGWSGNWKDLGISGDWRDLGVSLGCQASSVFINITG